tara:strand:+ start:497 stop:733 length:237 start_codon:yes stop_codon:yes gene_type:complete
MYDQFFFPPFQGVVVVSDTDLKKLKLQKKESDLKILQQRKSEIEAAISELQNEIKILSPPTEKEINKNKHLVEDHQPV